MTKAQIAELVALVSPELNGVQSVNDIAYKLRLRAGRVRLAIDCLRASGETVERVAANVYRHTSQTLGK